MKSTPFVSPVSVRLSEQGYAGVSTLAIAGSTSTFTVFGIAGAQATTLTMSDASGASGTLTLTPGACGRPDDLNPSPVLLSPANGSTNVDLAAGTLYFGVYTVSSNPASIRLHVIVGNQTSFESGALSPTTLPAGVVTAPPVANKTLTYEKASIPILVPGTSYSAQLYDDACQPPEVAGSFST